MTAGLGLSFVYLRTNDFIQCDTSLSILHLVVRLADLMIILATCFTINITVEMCSVKAHPLNALAGIA